MNRDRAAELAGLDPDEVFTVVERGDCVVVIDVTGRKHVVCKPAPDPAVTEYVSRDRAPARARVRRGGHQ